MKFSFRRSHPAEQAPSATTEAMQALRRAGYPDLAAAVDSTEGQRHLRGIWRRIDEASLATSGIGRIFAGISQDGGRYFEVYGRDGLYVAGTEKSVSVAIGDLISGDLHITTGQRSTGTRNGETPIAFDDPLSTSGHLTELVLRPALHGGTSSHYKQSNNPHEYGGEIFPMASLQAMAGFSPEDLRISMADDGQAASRGIKINAAPLREQPKYDPDDIAI